MADNPFAPGMALPPPVLAGRDEYLSEFKQLLRIAREGGSTPTRVFIGHRGVGKTALLNECVHLARARGWMAVRLTCDPDPLQSAMHALMQEREALRAQLGKRGPRSRRTAAVDAGVNLGVVRAGVSVPPPRQDHTTPRRTLVELAAAAKGARVGLYLAFDELQAAQSPELRTIASLMQDVASERLPVVIAGAGLPQLRERTPDEAAITFTERAAWTPLGALRPEDAERALREPFEDNGVTLTDGALRRLVQLSEGYPYLVQLLGAATWDVGEGASRITEAHVDAAERRALAQLDEGMYRIRWNKCSPLEREYVAALARLGLEQGSDEVPSGDVARAIGRTAQALSMVRKRLMLKQIIEPAPGRRMRLTMPWFDRYALQKAQEESLTPRLSARWRSQPREHQE